MNRRPALFASLLAFACACGSSQKNGADSPSESAATANGARREPPKLRLPDNVQPVKMTLDLTIVPSEERFRGTASILLDLKSSTDVIWLNATELTVKKAKLEQEKSSLPATAIVAAPDFVGFELEEPAGPGRATLVIEYDGPFSTKENEALYKLPEGDELYVYTQFEPIDARRAFPCFDEPSFKIPWEVTLHVKREHIALSNTPSIEEKDEGNGMKAVHFAETKPLPSYLVALAVGPFEGVDGGTAGGKKTQIRIITPKGKATEARWASESTGPILELLEEYFGSPYPYEKLDHISIPQNTGAMENPGLITFGHQLILNKPDRDHIWRKRAYASVATHELAHQWFGDLVTMSWWDDLWLNEAFATWATPKILEKWKPAWDIPVDRVGDRSFALTLDGLTSARKIRQPIESNNDINNAFDGITYSKGAAVIGMFEQWVGPEKFRKGIQKYLGERAFKNATATDFFAAISAEAGVDVGTPFRTFVDQPGAPLVTIALTCTKGQKPSLSLSQRRYLPLGSPLAAEQGQGQTKQAAQLWSIPICVRYGAKKDNARQCTLLTEQSSTMVLESDACPDWVLANEGEIGYYRVDYQGDLLDRLLRAKNAGLTLAERVGVYGDVVALVKNGAFPANKALGFARDLANDPDRQVVETALSMVASVDDDILPDEVRPAFEKFVRATFSKRARELGFTAKLNEDEDTKLMRPKLIELVAIDGNDPDLQAKARQLAAKWIEDREAIDPDLIETVLAAAAMRGDRALFDRFQAAAKTEADRRDRNRMLSTLGKFRNPEIAKAALGLVLSPDIDGRDSMQIFWSLAGDFRTRALAYDFMKTNFDALIARLPRDYGARLPFAGATFCDGQRAEDVETFFKDRAPQYRGGPRNLAQALERIALCRAFREKQQTSVVAFFRAK